MQSEQQQQDATGGNMERREYDRKNLQENVTRTRVHYGYGGDDAGNMKRTRIENAIAPSMKPHTQHLAGLRHESQSLESDASEGRANPMFLFTVPDPQSFSLNPQLLEAQHNVKQCGERPMAPTCLSDDNPKAQSTPNHLPRVTPNWSPQWMDERMTSSSFSSASLAPVNEQHFGSTRATGSSGDRNRDRAHYLDDVAVGFVRRATVGSSFHGSTSEQRAEAGLDSGLRQAPPDLQSHGQHHQHSRQKWSTSASSISTPYEVPMPDGWIREQCDPRARQSADRALVAHTLRVEPSSDAQFDLRITTEATCSNIVCFI